MATIFFRSALRSAASNPYGNYRVSETPNGICFQVTTHHPDNKWVAASLFAKTILLVALFHNGIWSFLGMLCLLLPLDGVFYFFIRRIRLAWIEVRPDGFSVTQDAARPDVAHFFDRRAVERHELGFDTGVALRYGIHDVQATPPFVIPREFEIFSIHFEKTVSRMWHQQNL